MSKIGKVACAISGGVDSAVSAFLLKRNGYDVVGVHMLNWDTQDGHEDSFSCPQSKDLKDSQKLCEELDIPFHTVNFVKEYWNTIFTKFIENYSRGRAVIPDIACNKYVKFDLLWKFATEKLGADTLATGHFARTSRDLLGKKSNQKVKLLRAKDPIKDQTFFLSSLNHKQLENVLFPVGSLFKSEVREIASSANLHTFSNKPESMGICFIGKQGNFESFLSKYIESIQGTGKFVDIDTGKELLDWRHDGVHNFAAGKRVHPPKHLKLGNESVYVSGIDVMEQIVYVCRGHTHPKLYSKLLLLSNPNWISDDPSYIIQLAENNSKQKMPSQNSLRMTIQRTHYPILCHLSLEGDSFIVEPSLPLRAVVPGQMCVFYAGDECIGCAEVERILNTL